MTKETNGVPVVTERQAKEINDTYHTYKNIKKDRDEVLGLMTTIEARGTDETYGILQVRIGNNPIGTIRLPGSYVLDALRSQLSNLNAGLDALPIKEELEGQTR